MNVKLPLLPAFTLLSLTVLASNASAELSVKQGSQVKLHYTMKAEGAVIDDTRAKEPFEFIFGDSPIMPGLEKAIEGMLEGTTKDVKIEAKDAFGEIDPEVIITVPRQKFDPDQPVEVGTIYSIPSPEGLPIQGVVKKIEGDQVTIDFNHPLAGKTLEMNIEVLEIK